MVSIFEKYIGQNIIIYSKKGLRYEGKLLSVSKEGFIEINEIKIGKKGIAISEISDYDVRGDRNGA